MQLKSERFEMRLDPQTLQQVEGWRAEQPDRPSRAEAVRRLVADGLARSGTEELRISDGEKLLLMLLCNRMRQRDVGDETDPEFVLDAIGGGHYWALRWEYEHLLTSHIDSPEALVEVVDALDMWDFIESSYAGLSTGEREEIATRAEPFGTAVTFSGFDGNYETEHLNIARFLINKMGRFGRFKGRSLNSHAPTVEAFRRMQLIFESMRPNLVGRGLSLTEIVALLRARRRPSQETNS